MSTHAFPLGDRRRLQDIVLACHDAGRAPTSVDYDGTTLTLTFTPDLTAAEVTRLGEFVRAYESLLTPTERNGIQADVDLLVTFQGIASPTLAQAVAAIKAQGRILRAILRS
jgi:hypothetical protein